MNRISLSDCLDYVIDNRGVTPHKRNTEWSDSGVPVLSANNVKTSGLIRIDEIRYVPNEVYSSWMKSPLTKGDLLLTSEAPAGEIYYWDSDEKVIVGQRLYGLKVKSGISSKYLKYYLESSKGQKAINGQQSGSTVFGISAKTFDNIMIDLPEYEEQVRIGELLYSIDKQINRNMQMVQKLQVLAQSSFHYFFAAFSSKKAPLSLFIVENKKSALQVNEVEDTKGAIPFFTSGDTIKYIHENLVDGFNLFLSTGGNASVKSYYGKASYSTDTWCITAKNDMQFYIFEYLKMIENQMDSLYFHGTGLKHLQKPLFLNSEIPVPIENLAKYNTIVEPIFKKISEINIITIKLNNLKTNLLPLLINGQLL